MSGYAQAAAFALQAIGSISQYFGEKRAAKERNKIIEENLERDLEYRGRLREQLTEEFRASELGFQRQIEEARMAGAEGREELRREGRAVLASVRTAQAGAGAMLSKDVRQIVMAEKGQALSTADRNERLQMRQLRLEMQTLRPPEVAQPGTPTMAQEPSIMSLVSNLTGNYMNTYSPGEGSGGGETPGGGGGGGSPMGGG